VLDRSAAVPFGTPALARGGEVPVGAAYHRGPPCIDEGRYKLVASKNVDTGKPGVKRRSFEPEAAVFKAFADPYRLQILAMLARSEEEVCVCEFTDALPLNQPTVSHHLRVLRDCELVLCERRGTWVYYRLAPDAVGRVQKFIRNVFKEATAA
jgi:DNA-binding transcriptional ArsR family regulator